MADLDETPGPGEPPFGLPAGRKVRLPGRGETWIRELAGPTGAPTVLLLHGWTATADLNWVTSYRALAKRFNIVAIDHRGHGRGIRALRPFRLEDCADDAAALCRELGLESVIVVGYSMGGPISLLVWKRHHDLVDGLVLCATSRRFSAASPRQRALLGSVLGMSMVARLTPDGLRRELVKRYVTRRVDGDPAMAWALEQLRRHDGPAIIQAGAAIGSFDSRAWLGEIDVPTAVVITDQDVVVPTERQERLARSIPGATTFHVAGGHGVVLEAPNRFVPQLLAAAKDVNSRRSTVAV